MIGLSLKIAINYQNQLFVMKKICYLVAVLLTALAVSCETGEPDGPQGGNNGNNPSEQPSEGGGSTDDGGGSPGSASLSFDKINYAPLKEAMGKSKGEVTQHLMEAGFVLWEYEDHGVTQQYYIRGEAGDWQQLAENGPCDMVMFDEGGYPVTDDEVVDFIAWSSVNNELGFDYVTEYLLEQIGQVFPEYVENGEWSCQGFDGGTVTANSYDEAMEYFTSEIEACYTQDGKGYISGGVGVPTADDPEYGAMLMVDTEVEAGKVVREMITIGLYDYSGI